MRTAAIITNNKVTNVIVIADGAEGDNTLEQLQAVEVTDKDVRIGDEYNGANFIRIKTTQEIESEEAYAKVMQRRKELALKLGLTEEEVVEFFGL